MRSRNKYDIGIQYLNRQYYPMQVVKLQIPVC